MIVSQPSSPGTRVTMLTAAILVLTAVVAGCDGKRPPQQGTSCTVAPQRLVFDAATLDADSACALATRALDTWLNALRSQVGVDPDTVGTLESIRIYHDSAVTLDWIAEVRLSRVSRNGVVTLGQRPEVYAVHQ